MQVKPKCHYVALLYNDQSTLFFENHGPATQFHERTGLYQCTINKLTGPGCKDINGGSQASIIQLNIVPLHPLSHLWATVVQNLDMCT